MSLLFPDDNVERSQVQYGDNYRRQMEQAQRYLQQNNITPEQVLAMQRQSPNGSPGLLSSNLAAGYGSQEYAALAGRDPGHDQFNWYDPSDWVTEGLERATSALSATGSLLYEQVLKPLVRGAFAVTEGLSQELVQRPLSALMAGAGAADEDVSVREAYNQYGTSAFFQALGNVIGDDEPDEVGKGFDLGTGFFTGGAAQLQAEEARRLMVAGQKANIGRLYLDPQLQMVGLSPGDRVYDIATGVAQFAAEVFLDPSVVVTGGTAGIARGAGRAAGAGSRLLGGADELVKFTDDAGEVIREITRAQHTRERVAEALTIDGLSQRARASRQFGQVREESSVVQRQLREALFPNDPEDKIRSIDEVADTLKQALDAGDTQVKSLLNEAIGLIEGPNGKSAIFDTLTAFTRKDGLLEVLAEADPVALGDGFKAGRNSSLPSEFITAIGEATTKDEVAGILNEAISLGHVQDRNFYGGFGSMVRNRAPAAMVEKVDKFSGIAARGFLSAWDKDVALGKVDTLARQAGLDRETRNEIFRRFGRMEEGDTAELFSIATFAYDAVAKRLRNIDPDAGDNWVMELSNAYDAELENLRAFNVAENGEHAEGLQQMTVKKIRPDGSWEEVTVPTPHLLNEMNSMSVPLPDIDDIRRANTKSDLAKKVYESAGWARTNRSLRFITRQLFKPLVLLRPAYIARTQIDDQLRMWASGVDGAIRNPRHLIQLAHKAPDELARMAAADPSMARYTKRILNQSILDIDGNSIAKGARERIYTIIQKPFVEEGGDVAEEMKDYITAWRKELGQLSNDRLAHHLIANGLDVEATLGALFGRRISNPEAVAKMERQAAVFKALEEATGTWTGKTMNDGGVIEEAKSAFIEESLPQRIEDQLSRLRDGRSLDTMVDPFTGQNAVPTGHDLGLDLDADIPFDPDDPFGDMPDPFDDFPEPDFEDEFEEAITLGEFLDMQRSSDDLINRAKFEATNDFVRDRGKYVYSHLLKDSDLDPEEVASLLDDLQKSANRWVGSSGGKMHTERESGPLLRWVRQTGAAGRRTYRGERMSTAVFNRMMADGLLEPGQSIRVSRMQSASSDADGAGIFASHPMTPTAEKIGVGPEKATQVVWDYDESVRSQNFEAFNPGEGEWLMPEQEVRIRSIEKREGHFANGEDQWVIKVDAVPHDGLIGQVMAEGPQPWMKDLNLGRYDGTPQSLAGEAWDTLDPAIQREYEQLHDEMRTLLDGDLSTPAAREALENLQYYSPLRHVVDNAPPLKEDVYLPGSVVQPQMNEFKKHLTGIEDASDLRSVGMGQEVRTDTIPLHGSTNIPRRINRGTVDPSNLDEDVVVRLPRGSQGLRVGDDYLVPPSGMRVTAVRQRADGKTIVDVEVTQQPKSGVAVYEGADPDAHLRSHVAAIANSSNPAVRRLVEDEEYARGYLESVKQRILTKTNGNQHLLDLLEGNTNKFDLDGAERAWVDITEDDAGFERILAQYAQEDSPAFLKAQRFPDNEVVDRNVLEQMTAFGYEYIVSKPAAYLSRYPAWVEFMSRDLVDIMPTLRSDDLRREVLEMAETQLGMSATQMDRLRKAAVDASGKSGVVGSVDEARELALMHSTESVEDLLFDVSNKSAFQDSFDVIFPFVDAWREGLEVWSRLMKENPAAMLKGLAAFRGGEETGALYTNERGERMFAMPFSGTLGNFVQRKTEGQSGATAAFGAVADTVRGEFDEDAIAQVQTQMDFRLSGVNLMFNSVGPGFGPVVQWPAGAFLPDTPEFQGLQELINPYGDAFDSAGDIANPAAYVESLTPAWAKKVVNAWTSGNVDPIQWNGAVHDALRALEMSGNYDPSDPEDRDRLTVDAERSARWMLMVRGLVHGVAPTGPEGGYAVKTDGVSEDFEEVRGWDPEADPDGVWHNIDTLATAYWDLYERVGDSTLAQQKFIEAYGVTPAYLRAPKSKVLSNLPATKAGAFWAQDHRGAMERYPVVAGYFAPPDEGNENFDYAVWRQQFASGQREMITPAQQLALVNRSEAQQIYYNFKDRIDSLEGVESNRKTMVLAAVKGKLNEKYPGWQWPVAGITNIPTDAKIEQLRVAAQDPDLADSPLSTPLNQYFQLRELLLAKVAADSGQPNATLSRQDAEGARQALTRAGTMLATRDPYFRGVWDLLKREVDEA